MKNKPIEKIGLFGGTFDPVHLGHLIVAEVVADQLNLNRVIFIPAHIHPLKNTARIQEPQHRLNMLHLAVQDNPRFQVSTMELDKGGVSYTVDTLRAFREIYPSDGFALFFLLGADNVNQFHLWKEPEELVRLCRFVAFGRPGFTPSEEARPYLSAFQFVNVPQIEISATEIRRRVRQGRSIRYMVLPPVLEYIQKHQLYQESRAS
ncbi:MAG: nicotinate-nucleotide adenylyltransferase [Calditrichaeota bacterium]|nr:MAG: nicotinate-nucleotide adenylyltransferase [Calditrichota bacterium]